jgi:thiamine-phosphate pyrophosphorylase
MFCLVTDRRRLAGADTTLDEARRCLVSQARFAVEAGIELLQVRERDLEAAAVASIVSDLLRVTHGTRTRLVVNDRLDIALACGADGVHLRSDSIAPAVARRIAPAGFLVGRSVHSVEDAVHVAAADYVIAGTVFPTRAKPTSQPILGVDGLAAIVRSVDAPVLAIGGMTEANVADVARAGAAGCAAIGLFMAAEGARGAASCRAVSLRLAVEQVRRRFDSVKTAP